MSVDEAERFARAWRATALRARRRDGVDQDIEQRTVLDVLSVSDPRQLDVDRLWAPTRTQGSQWLRFPVGSYTTPARSPRSTCERAPRAAWTCTRCSSAPPAPVRSEGIITEVVAACLTHSPEVLNIVFTDFKLKSAAGTLSRFPHVLASVSNLAEEKHLVGRLYDTLDGELDRRGEMLAALDDCPDVTAYNQRRLQDPSLPPIPALWVITDEYNEVFADPIWGPKFRRLYLADRPGGPLAAHVLEAGRPDHGHPESA